MKTSSTKKISGKNSNKFDVGEKILCYQSSHIYEAKCINFKKSGTNILYLVHYRGWKSRYDEWVTSDRILKYNQENLKLQQNLRQNCKEKFKLSKKKKKDKDKIPSPTATPTTKTEKSNEKEKLKQSDSSESISADTNYQNLTSKDIEVPAFVEKQDDFIAKHEVKIRIPENLKTILLDDWDLIINQKKLVNLPFKFNIEKIFNDYFINKTQSPKLPLNHSLEGYIDFLKSVRKYFNFFIDKCLLYPSEKQQMEYLVQNYDEFTTMMNQNELGSDKNKSRRVWKKFKRSNSKSKNLEFVTKLSSALNDDDLISLETADILKKVPFINDQNSQSETSDSCTSTEVSSTEYQNTLNNKQDPPSKQDGVKTPLTATTSTSNDNNNNNNNKIIKKKIDFTKLYGPVHLLRLFYKMGQFLFYTDLDSDRISLAESYIYDFLKFLSKDLWVFTHESYIEADLLLSKF